jgi:hypothetical protein
MIADWIYLGQDAVKWEVFVNTVMHFRAPQSVGNYLTSSATIGYSRKIQQLYEISRILI